MSELTAQQIIEATIASCGHLELRPFLDHIKKLTSGFSPVEKIILAGLQPRDSLMMIWGITDRGGFREISNRLRTAPEVTKLLSGMGAPITMFGRASAALPAKGLVEAGLLAGDASVMVVRMVIGRKMIGLFFLAAEPGRAFARSHGYMLGQLRRPLSVGLKNGLRCTTACNRYQSLVEKDKYFSSYRDDGETTQEIVGGADGAARLLGVHPSTLRKRMRKLPIPFGRTAQY